jgi:hypothetical protein
VEYDKPHLELSQQVEKLASNGLQISDRDRAARFLETVGYYRVSVRVRAFERGGPLSELSTQLVDPLWNEFLMEPLTKSPRQVTPLSVLGISSHHVQQAHHEDVTSYVLCSEAVAQDVESLRREQVVIKGVVRRTSDTFDALIRVDVAGPVPLEAIHAIGRRSAPEPDPQPASPVLAGSGV